MSAPFITQNVGVNAVSTVNVAHQQVAAKLSVINNLRTQKATSKIPEEQDALQVLIDVRSTEAQPLLTAYVNAFNTFVGTHNIVPTGPTGSSS